MARHTVMLPVYWRRVTGVLSTRDLDDNPLRYQTQMFKLPLWRDFWIEQWNCAGRLPKELTAPWWAFVVDWIRVKRIHWAYQCWTLRQRLYVAIHGHNTWEDDDD